MGAGFQIIGLVVGGLAGFAVGHYLLMYILKGEDIAVLAKSRVHRVWLGAFGWFVALVGAWSGWQAAPPLARAWGF